MQEARTQHHITFSFKDRGDKGLDIRRIMLPISVHCHHDIRTQQIGRHNTGLDRSPLATIHLETESQHVMGRGHAPALIRTSVINHDNMGKTVVFDILNNLSYNLASL